MPIAANIIAMWSSTNVSIPSGWTEVTSLSDRFTEGGSSSNSHSTSTAGATNHDHTGGSHSHSVAHTHTGNALPNSQNASTHRGGYTNPATYGNYDNHTHPSTTSSSVSGNTGSTGHTWGNAANAPASFRMIFIESDGGPAGFADGMVGFFYSGTPPTDWIQHVASADKFIKGMSTGGDGGGSTGAATHTHGGTSHSHTVSNHTHATFNSATSDGWSNTYDWEGTFNYQGTLGNHYHAITYAADTGGGNTGAITPSTATTSSEPLFHTLLAIEYDAALDDQPVGLIAMWLGDVGDIPKGWALCDGSTGSVSGITTPDLRSRFIKCADAGNDVGTRSGSNSHSHSTSGNHGMSHTHNMSHGASNENYYAGLAPAASLINHAHPVSASSNGTSLGGNHAIGSQGDSRPSLRTVLYLLLDEPQLGGFAGGPSGAGYFGGGAAHF